MGNKNTTISRHLLLGPLIALLIALSPMRETDFKSLKVTLNVDELVIASIYKLSATQRDSECTENVTGYSVIFFEVFISHHNLWA